MKFNRDDEQWKGFNKPTFLHLEKKFWFMIYDFKYPVINLNRVHQLNLLTGSDQ